MAKNSVTEWSTTAASNTDVGGVGIQGTSPASNMDDGLREIMEQVAVAITDGSMMSLVYESISGNDTVAATDKGQLFDCTATLELELPAVATAGAGFFFIAKANGGTVTLDPNGTENINGSSTSATVSDGSAAIVVCNGMAWFTLTIGTGNVTTTGTQTLTNKTLTQPTLTLKQGASVAPTAEGDIQWDTDDNRLVVGDGAAAKTFSPNPASTAAGDIEYYTAADTKARLAKGSKGQSIRQNSAETAPEWGGPGVPDAVLEDQKAQGTDGGTFTSGAWQTRDLNTEVRDAYSLISISSNQFTPTANGWVEWSAPAIDCDEHQSRLYNVTDGAVVGYGSTQYSNNGSFAAVTASQGGGAVVAGKTYRIEHRAATTKNSTGFGNAANLATEVYTRVKFWRA